MTRLLDRLKRYQGDRGMMAQLRCALTDSRKHRAWPALARLGLDIDNPVAAFVAGLYALDPDSATEERLDFGAVCRQLRNARGERREDEKVTPVERRFMSLLAAQWGDELFGRVLRLARMAQREGIRIEYDGLAQDLSDWNESVKTRWAKSFWSRIAESETGKAGTDESELEGEGEA